MDIIAVQREAIRSAENDGIVFIDEIDKIAARDGGMGAGVSDNSPLTMPRKP